MTQRVWLLVLVVPPRWRPQAMSYSPVLTGHHCLIADQTGSGKTLAYLAPLVQRLRYMLSFSLTVHLDLALGAERWSQRQFE